MKKAIEILIGEMESKLGGYAGLLNYRFLNLCVKAEPVALISVVIEDKEGDTRNIEDVARTMLINKYQFEIFPMEQDMIFNICQGILTDHPEFKQEVVTSSDDRKLYQDVVNEQHIILTVPEVNKDRHDFLMDAVKTLYDQCKIEVDKTNAAYTTKLAAKIAGMSAEEIEEAKNKLEESQQKYVKICDDYLAAKQKEIEDAYQHYLEEQAAKNAKEEEIAATRINRSSNSMQMGHYEE